MAEKKIRESEQKYRTIVETVSEGIWITDTEARTTFVNEKMAEMLGYRPEEMIGKLTSDFMDEEAIALSKLNFEQRLQGHTDHYEQKYIRKNGSTLWAIASAVPLRDKYGQVIASMGIIMDITERKQAEEELKRRHNDLNAAYEEITSTQEELRQNIEELQPKRTPAH